MRDYDGCPVSIALKNFFFEFFFLLLFELHILFAKICSSLLAQMQLIFFSELSYK